MSQKNNKRKRISDDPQKDEFLMDLRNKIFVLDNQINTIKTVFVNYENKVIQKRIEKNKPKVNFTTIKQEIEIISQDDKYYTQECNITWPRNSYCFYYANKSSLSEEDFFEVTSVLIREQQDHANSY